MVHLNSSTRAEHLVTTLLSVRGGKKPKRRTTCAAEGPTPAHVLMTPSGEMIRTRPLPPSVISMNHLYEPKDFKDRSIVPRHSGVHLR